MRYLLYLFTRFSSTCCCKKFKRKDAKAQRRKELHIYNFAPWRLCVLYSLFFLLLRMHALFAASDAVQLQKRMQAHCTIYDPKSALNEIQNALKENPDDFDLLRLELDAHAACTNIAELLHAYKTYRQVAHDAYDATLLEKICWAILVDANQNPSSLIRQHSLISAFFTQDAQSIPFFLRALHDTSSQVRTLFLKLACHIRDDSVQKNVYEHFLHTSSPVEKMLALQALASTHFTQIQEKLFSALENEQSSVEEKTLAIDALSQSLSGCSDDHLKKHLESRRVHLRIACCHSIMREQKRALLSYVEPLVFDSSQEVRSIALQCIGLMSKKDSAFITSNEFLALLNHSDMQTRLLAAWVLVVHGKMPLCEELLKLQLLSTDKNVSLFAASLLAHSRQEGLKLLSWGMHYVKDPLVRLNLAIGLIYLKTYDKIVQEILLDVLSSKNERLSWHEHGIFSYIGPTTYCHTPQKASVPETVDLLTRLDLFRMLASQSDIDLSSHLRPILTARAWGVTLEASAFVMQENSEGFESLELLLDEKNPEVSLQAAFILAHFTQNEKALDVLEKQYPKVSRELKEYILIAIGQIGAKRSIEFLTSVLDESFVGLRISAARSILLCLNH